MKTVIIGGGPAGLISAISAANNGQEVILLEKMKECRKKTINYRKR